MAYVNQKDKQVIKEALDKVLKPLGFKFSLKIAHHSKITLTLRSGPIDFVEDHINHMMTNRPHEFNAEMAQHYKQRNYIDINHYWYEEHYSPKVADIIGKIVKAMKSANWYDKSDAMVDYFDTAYYYGVTVGTWEKPYQVTK